MASQAPQRSPIPQDQLVRQKLGSAGSIPAPSVCINLVIAGATMNTAEHIVESYFRLCRGCFTFPDRKVVRGNNRQLDILAYDVKRKLQFHIEVGVTHRLTWCSTRDELGAEFQRKFFGIPPERVSSGGAATDFERGKSYFSQIEQTYIEAGFSPSDVRRVWVCWIVRGDENNKPFIVPFHSEHLNRTFEIEVLSLRDVILPQLENAIETANYDDEILRTLSFMKQRETQAILTRRQAALAQGATAE